MDAKDILGVKGGGAAAGPSAGRKPREEKGGKPRPKGINREVWQITQGYNAEAPPPPLVPTLGFKERRKPASKRTVTWQLKPFANSARGDGLELMHWVKRMEGGAPMVRPGSNGGDANGDYAFVKYNKKIEMLDYNDIEWNILGLAGGPDGSWGRGETDYLMGLCRSLDLRWPVIADRYSWADPEAAADTPPKQRGVDELKARYYSLAHTLLISRSEGAETVAHKELVRRPYDASAEADRREMLGALLQRSGGAAGEEEALLAAAAAVEARRRSEVEGAHKTGLPLQVLCRPAAPPPAQAPMGGGGSVVASLLGKLVIPDISLGPGDVDPNEEPGGPDLPTPRGQSQQPPPGCYARAAHTAACAQELVALGGAGTQGKPRDRKAADSLNRRIDLAMEELGVPAPQTGTRAVCRAWYALRKEVAQLLELRSQLARKSKESAAAAAVVAGVAGHGGGQPFSPLGGMSSPKASVYPPTFGAAAPPSAASLPSMAPPPASSMLPPPEVDGAARSHKRKAPRFGEEEEAAAPKSKKKR